MISVDYFNIARREECVETFCFHFSIELLKTKASCRPLFLVALLVGCVLCAGRFVWPGRRVMFPFLVLNFLSGTGPKGHPSSTSSTSRTNYNSTHGSEGRHVNEDGGGADKEMTLEED